MMLKVSQYLEEIMKPSPSPLIGLSGMNFIRWNAPLKSMVRMASLRRMSLWIKTAPPVVIEVSAMK